MAGVGTVVLRATLVCGTLDIAYALVMSVLKGGSVAGVLMFVAQGPLGKAAPTSPIAASATGLAVHFAIMAVMASVFVMLARSTKISEISPWIGGTVYGLVLYLTMYWIVLPARWPSIFPQTGLLGVAEALFAHIVLVGIPMAFITKRYLLDVGNSG